MKLFDHAVMAHSDTEEVYESTDPGSSKQLSLTDALGLLGDTETYEKTIHSGHFMVSHVHDDMTAEEEKELDDDLIPKENDTFECTIDTGKVSAIDSSLTKLFQCMSLVGKYLYNSGKLTSPKWKNFRGIKFRLKEKIRLNNIIWREWHMQYVKCLPPIVCNFSSPLAECADLNCGMIDRTNWKRHLKAITNDYKKWMHYFNNKFMDKNSGSDLLSSNLPYCEILQRTSENNSKRLTNLGGIVKKSLYQNPPNQLFLDDDFFSDLSDTLFSAGMLMEGSNLREIPAFSDENFMESIQDSCLNDIMDTLEPLPPSFRCEFFNRGNSAPSTQSSTMLTNDIGQLQNVCGPNQSSMDNAMINSNDELLSLSPGPSMLNNNNSEANKPVNYQMASSDQLLSLFVSQDSLTGSNVMGGGGMVAPSYASESSRMDEQQKNNNFVIDNIFQVSPSTASNYSIELHSGNLLLSDPDPSKKVFNVFYSSNSSSGNNTQCSQNSQSMPVLTSLLQQHKQPVIIQLPPGYQIITSHDVIGQEDVPPPLPAVKSGTFVGLGGSAIRLQNTKPANQIASKSLGCLQAVQNARESNRFRHNSSTGSLAAKHSVSFRIPQQQQQTKIRQKTSNLVNIQPRPPYSSSSPSLQSNCIKQLLLPSSTSPTPVSSNQFSSFKPLHQEPTPSHYCGLGSSNVSASLMCDNRKRSRCERSDSPSVINHQSSDHSTQDFFNSIFQPINPLVNHSGSSASKVSYKNLKSSTSREPEQQQFEALHQNTSPSQYSTDSSIGSNVRGNVLSDDCHQLFKMPVRSRHASNDSASSHCDDSFMSGQNKLHGKDLRRISHITSEQKRRFSIKCGLDTLNDIIPSLNAMSGGRVSKATTLHKAVEFCRKLKADKQEMQEEIDRVRHEVHSYELAIKNVHSQMPVQGLPSSSSRTKLNQFSSWFHDFILQRSQDNWKFWIFGFIIEPLFSSFENVVNTSSVDQFRQTVLKWLVDNCSLVTLRPIVSNSLRKLSTSTCILVNPNGFQNEVIESINESSSATNLNRF